MFNSKVPSTVTWNTVEFAGLSRADIHHVTTGTHLRTESTEQVIWFLLTLTETPMQPTQKSEAASFLATDSALTNWPPESALHAGSALIRSTWGCQGALHVTRRVLRNLVANGSTRGRCLWRAGPIPEVGLRWGRDRAGRPGCGKWRPRPVSWNSPAANAAAVAAAEWDRRRCAEGRLAFFAERWEDGEKLENW